MIYNKSIETSKQQTKQEGTRMYKMSFSYKGGCGVFYLNFSTFEKAKEYAEQIKDEVNHYPTIWKDE